MSTTRWIIETPCEHGEVESCGVGANWDRGASRWKPNSEGPGDPCPGGSGVVVDLENLPSERIERAARHMAEKVKTHQNMGKPVTTEQVGRWMFGAVRAFFSDPEPGDQT